jgi:hypothetical protein
MLKNVSETLKMFLAFEIWRKNPSAATEIVKLCIELNIELTHDENKQYVDLLLNRKRSVKTTKIDQKAAIEKYKFKF